MKKRYRIVKAAEEVDDSQIIDNKLKDVKYDFDYIVDGVDKLSRQGQRTSDMLDILNKLESSLSEITTEIAKYIVEAS